ncbi:hypothetical protein [Streptomyces sp. XC 2026]|uniref:hypothetical protein n=1 Tax=Streptomyces sp. XC 2026 TaxID=2782004 RepID=UPI001907B946|nr:hypothetical protein [Streptomyces sp. XC 2026]QQN80036.1 hypothetical protein IPZ77_23395 [Streptomyces sp. XC 2026]
MTRNRVIAAVAVLSLLSLAGCGSGGEDDTATPTPGPPEVTGTPDPQQPGWVLSDLGGEVELDDGLRVSAKVGEVFVPDDFGSYDDGGRYALVVVSATNGTGAPLTLDGMVVECVVDGIPAERVTFDGITVAPPSAVDEGAEATWSEACSLGEGQGLEFGLGVGDRDAVWFMGAVEG